MRGSLHTPGPWRVGKGGVVVADTPSHPNADTRDLGYYGGYLIAESIARVDDARLIASAPDVAEVLDHPGFRGIRLTLDAETGRWRYVVEIAISSNHVEAFEDRCAMDALTLAAAAVRAARPVRTIVIEGVDEALAEAIRTGVVSLPEIRS